MLDLYWGVGRLWFETMAEFRHYANSVIAYETAPTPPTSRQMALFATAHDFDAATQLFNRCVAKPLAIGEGVRPVPIGQRQKFGLLRFLGDDATKSALAGIYCGETKGGTPALLFSGSHGMEFAPDDKRQADGKAPWSAPIGGGFGSIKEDAWFGASDVPMNAKLHGMIHFMFSCYGGGSPPFDNFDRLNQSPRRVAAGPLLSVCRRRSSHTRMEGP